MKKLIAALCVVAFAAGAQAEDFAIRPSVWGTQKWPGGYDLYASGVKVGEAKASVWGQQKWYGGYDVHVDDSRMTRAQANALLQTLR
jgi:opacity protein-like surface antigen